MLMSSYMLSTKPLCLACAKPQRLSDGAKLGTGGYNDSIDTKQFKTQEIASTHTQQDSFLNTEMLVVGKKGKGFPHHFRITHCVG